MAFSDWGEKPGDGSCWALPDVKEGFIESDDFVQLNKDKAIEVTPDIDDLLLYGFITYMVLIGLAKPLKWLHQWKKEEKYGPKEAPEDDNDLKMYKGLEGFANGAFSIMYIVLTI